MLYQYCLIDLEVMYSLTKIKRQDNDLVIIFPTYNNNYDKIIPKIYSNYLLKTYYFPLLKNYEENKFINNKHKKMFLNNIDRQYTIYELFPTIFSLSACIPKPDLKFL